MDTIHDLYTFAAKHRITIKAAQVRAGLSPNWASRARTGSVKQPGGEKFRNLRKALFDMAIENGTMPANISAEDAGKVGAAVLVQSEVAAIRESLAKIESVTGGAE